MKPRKILLINIFALWCLSAGAGYGQAQTTRRDSGSDDQINVTADKLTVSESGAQIEASGNVEIERQGTRAHQHKRPPISEVGRPDLSR
jgi:hypothetical protein